MDAILRMQITAADTETDDAYDDGLVHSHGWACSEGAERTIAQAEQQQQSALREDAAESHGHADDYDDGLVHGHGWASSR